MITIQHSYRQDSVKVQELYFKLVKYYEQYIGFPVFIRKDDGVECKGILKEFAPDGKLKIVGDYKESLIDPLDIRAFTCRKNLRGVSSGR